MGPRRPGESTTTAVAATVLNLLPGGALSQQVDGHHSIDLVAEAG